MLVLFRVVIVLYPVVLVLFRVVSIVSPYVVLYLCCLALCRVLLMLCRVVSCCAVLLLVWLSRLDPHLCMLLLKVPTSSLVYSITISPLIIGGLIAGRNDNICS